MTTASMHGMVSMHIDMFATDRSRHLRRMLLNALRCHKLPSGRARECLVDSRSEWTTQVICYPLACLYSRRVGKLILYSLCKLRQLRCCLSTS